MDCKDGLKTYMTGADKPVETRDTNWNPQETDNVIWLTQSQNPVGNCVRNWNRNGDHLCRVACGAAQRHWNPVGIGIFGGCLWRCPKALEPNGKLNLLALGSGPTWGPGNHIGIHVLDCATGNRMDSLINQRQHQNGMAPSKLFGRRWETHT